MSIRPVVRRVVTAAVSAMLLSGVALATAESATAAYDCNAGSVCFYTQPNGAGYWYEYKQQASHDFRIASLYYNYNTLPISFWTGTYGAGSRITHYTTAQRGFRNWTSDNWDRCRSHMDYY